MAEHAARAPEVVSDAEEGQAHFDIGVLLARFPDGLQLDPAGLARTFVGWVGGISAARCRGADKTQHYPDPGGDPAAGSGARITRHQVPQ